MGNTVKDYLNYALRDNTAKREKMLCELITMYMVL